MIFINFMQRTSQKAIDAQNGMQVDIQMAICVRLVQKWSSHRASPGLKNGPKWTPPPQWCA